jgi:hypothetical protein
METEYKADQFDNEQKRAIRTSIHWLSAVEVMRVLHEKKMGTEVLQEYNTIGLLEKDVMDGLVKLIKRNIENRPIQFDELKIHPVDISLEIQEGVYESLKTEEVTV